MLATINGDRIIALGRGPVKIPDDYPRNVGWERLRWDGKKIIDLADMPGFWVEFKAGAFVLHCIKLPATTYIEMAYAQRKNLYFDGAIKLKTTEQIDAELVSKQTQAVSNFLSSKICTAGSMAELVMVLTGVIALTAIYARAKDAAVDKALADIMPQLQALPLEKIAALVPGAVGTLKEIFNMYFSKLEEVNNGTSAGIQ